MNFVGPIQISKGPNPSLALRTQPIMVTLLKGVLRRGCSTYDLALMTFCAGLELTLQSSFNLGEQGTVSMHSRKVVFSFPRLHVYECFQLNLGIYYYSSSTRYFPVILYIFSEICLNQKIHTISYMDSNASQASDQFWWSAEIRFCKIDQFHASLTVCIENFSNLKVEFQTLLNTPMCYNMHLLKVHTLILKQKVVYFTGQQTFSILHECHCALFKIKRVFNAQWQLMF